MRESILKRYPDLTFDDVTLRDDGDGVYIEVWNSEHPKPDMSQVLVWVQEDGEQSPPLTFEEQLAEKDAKIRRLESQNELINADLNGLVEALAEKGIL